jgi:hypothetical protein
MVTFIIGVLVGLLAGIFAGAAYMANEAMKGFWR